jgi:hypothetical protein
MDSFLEILITAYCGGLRVTRSSEAVTKLERSKRHYNSSRLTGRDAIYRISISTLTILLIARLANKLPKESFLHPVRSYLDRYD